MTAYTYLYEPGATRYVRVKERADPTRHRPPKGWQAKAVEMDFHPLTFERLQQPTVFIRETYVGDQS